MNRCLTCSHILSLICLYMLFSFSLIIMGNTLSVQMDIDNSRVAKRNSGHRVDGDQDFENNVPLATKSMISSMTHSQAEWLESLTVDGVSCCCLAKIYDNDEGFRLNDMIEIVGIYNIESPDMEQFQSGSPSAVSGLSGLSAMVDFGMSELHQQQYPPFRLAPR